MDRILIKKDRDRSVSKRYEKAVLNGLNDIDLELSPYGVYEKNDKGYHEIVTYTYNGDDSFWRGFSNSYGEMVVENCSDNAKREKFIYNTDLSRKFISLENSRKFQLHQWRSFPSKYHLLQSHVLPLVMFILLFYLSSKVL